MYNAELKSRFVKDYTKSINTANVATTVFEAFEPYETSWNADLCTRDREELQPAIDEILALRSRSQWMSLTILKEYVKWCIAMITRDRVSGDTLMRGIRAVKKTATLRSILSKKSAKAIEDGLTQQQLSFYRVWMSGLFYRMYDRERAGIPVDFSEAATDFVADRTYVLNGRIKLEHKQNRIEKNYMEEYQRWKLAFSI